MSKQPFVKIYADNALASLMPLSLSGCGAWFKIVLVLSQAQNRGVKSMSRQAWARVLGASAEQADRVLDELKAEQAFDFEEDGSTLQITSRYMVRETKELEQNRSRQERFRENNGDITQKKRKNNGDITPQKEEGRNNNNNIGFSLAEVLEIASLPDVALGEADARKFFDFYAAQDWVRSNGQRITSLAPAMRSWKRNKGKFDATSGGKPQGDMEITLDELKAAYKHKINFYDAMHISTEAQIKALKSQDLESFKRYVDYEFDGILEIAKEFKKRKRK